MFHPGFFKKIEVQTTASAQSKARGSRSTLQKLPKELCTFAFVQRWGCTGHGITKWSPTPTWQSHSFQVGLRKSQNHKTKINGKWVSNCKDSVDENAPGLIETDAKAGVGLPSPAQVGNLKQARLGEVKP